jgi:hypothetical protein
MGDKTSVANVVSIRRRKQSIPKALRDVVFMRYCPSFDKVYCYVGCGDKITPFDFVCGHVVSEVNGGLLTSDNLRPICNRCNHSIGTNNMREFVKKYGFKSPLLIEDTEDQCETKGQCELVVSTDNVISSSNVKSLKKKYFKPLTKTHLKLKNKTSFRCDYCGQEYSSQSNLCCYRKKWCKFNQRPKI